MSYEYFLQAFENQGPQVVSTQKIIGIFEPYIVKRDETFLDLEFDDFNHCTIYMNTREPAIDSIMISRPCGHENMVRCMYEVMQLGYFVFFEPDGHGMITLLAETKDHLDEEMIEVLGGPFVAGTFEEFYQLWENNRD